MKLVFYSIVVAILLSGTAFAEKCDNTGGQGLNDPHNPCSFIKPVRDVIVGDPLTFECIHRESIGEGYEPYSGARISITNYNEYDEEFPMVTDSLDRNGRYTFTPTIAGEYSIRVTLDGEQRTSYFTVDKDPNAVEEIIESPTGGVVAAEEPEEEEPEAEENDTPANETEESKDFLNIMINGTETKEDKEAVSNLALMLVGFLIS